MADFLELLETIQSDSANARSIFSSDDGTRIRNAFKESLEYKRKLSSAVKFLAEVVSGHRPTHQLQEVMTTSDFPVLFGDILDRTLLAKYTEWPADWLSYAKRVLVNDFRDAKVFLPLFGADTQLSEVPEAAPYPDAALTEQTPFNWRVRKYGRRVPFSWETIINDNLGQLKDIPESLARAARRTEHRLVANLFIDANGPHASMYTVGNKNIINTTNGSPAAVGNNPVLSIGALQAAYIVLSKFTDESGEPIYRDSVTLVVPPALEVTALNLVNATQIWDSSILGGGQPDNGSTSGERSLIVNNWMRNRIRVVVDPYIPLIASTANGNTSWFMFGNPDDSREAIRIGFLRGHESPEIWMKSPNAVRVGGGTVEPMSGDFETDSIEYRVRHVTGVSRVDPKATVASNGSGS